MAAKNCFIDKSRPCDLTCKAAFPVDDAVDPIDCYFVWLAAHLGDSAFDFRRMMEGQLPDLDGDGPPPSGGAPGKGPGGGAGPGKMPPGFGGVSPN